MASTILTRTVTSTGNNKILTWSGWVKRSDSSTGQLIMANGDPASSNYVIFFEFTGASLRFIINSLGILANVETNAVFRDTSAWYHLVFNMDTTQATASNRIKMYVNGEQITSFATASYPSQNLGTQFNNADSVMSVGGRAVTGANTDFFNGYMAHVHFIDGTAYDASAFGETDTATGIWKPKTAPVVTYGTNGFFLKFENSASFGTDSSPNGNNFTVNGTMTQTIDTPSNVFATWNALDNANASTMSNGNTKITTVTGNYSPNTSTLRTTNGKWYWEVKLVQDTNTGANEADMVGVNNNSVQSATTNPSSIGINYRGNGRVWNYGGTSETPFGDYATFSTGDIIMVAMDLSDSTTGKLYFGKNGTWENSGNPVTGANSYDFTKSTEAWGAMVTTYSSGSSGIWEANFGNGVFGSTPLTGTTYSDTADLGIFKYEVPAGYYALCTKNINTQEYN